MPSLVVIHFTGMQSCDAALARLCDPAFEVSCHYLISETGDILALVPEDLRAWHAGAGQWAGAGDVNSRSIGIELANPGTVPFAAAQMAALETLLPAIMARWGIAPQGVVGHSDMAPARKADPGPRFDWRRLGVQGLSVWPGARNGVAVDETAFRRNLAAFGYDPGLDDTLLLMAFRQRFRPRHADPLDATDCALAADLARRWPTPTIDGSHD